MMTDFITSIERKKTHAKYKKIKITASISFIGRVTM
jgi:hypothetical protein